MLGRAGRGGQGVEEVNRMVERISRVAAVERFPEASCGATAQPALLGPHTSYSQSGVRPPALPCFAALTYLND